MKTPIIKEEKPVERDQIPPLVFLLFAGTAWKLHKECIGAVHAFSPNFPLVHLHDLPCYREAQPVALIHFPGFVDPVKPVKYPAEVLFGYCFSLR